MTYSDNQPQSELFKGSLVVDTQAIDKLAKKVEE